MSANKMIKFVTVLVLIFLLVACSAPTASTPTPAPIVTQVLVATPLPIPAVATATPTIAPTPTAWVTASPNNDPAIVPILMYHHLEDLPQDASELRRTWTVAPKTFESQIEWLAQRGFHTITMAQLVAHLKQRQPLPSKPIVISFDDGWADAYTVAYPILKKHGFIGTFFIYTNPIDHKLYVTWTQLEEMSSAGMDIQGHTLSHPHLRTLEPEAAMKEIVDSKAILEKRLGKPIVALAYPDGEYNNAIIDMVKRAGYESAVTLAAGYRQRPDELFTLHRIRVSYGDSLQDFANRLPQ